MAVFSTAISGLQASNKNLATIGNNVANASTVGFKSSRVEFGDLYSKSSLTMGSDQPGNGVQVAAISQQFHGGGVTYTQNNLDMKIQGNGFFIVNNPSQQQDLYTRAGTFGLDDDGFVVTNQGYRVQGFPANPTGTGISVGALGDIQIPASKLNPQATTEVEMAFNLDASQLPPSNFEFDPADPETYTHMYPTEIYDSLGNAHTMTQYFVKQPSYEPEFGEPSRALEAMLRYSESGTDALSAGDAADGATIDSDIADLLTTSGFAGFNAAASTFDVDPYAAGDDYDSATTTDAQRATQLQNIHDGLNTLVNNSTGKEKDFYQAAYDELTGYLPALTSGSLSAASISVFEGAMDAVRGVSQSPQNTACAKLDTLAGMAKNLLINSAATVDPNSDALNIDLDPNNPGMIDTAAAPYNGADPVQDVGDIITDLKDSIQALLDGADLPGSVARPATSAQWPVAGTDFNLESTSPTLLTDEEKSVYKLALDALNELSVSLDDGSGNVDSAAVIETLKTLETGSADNRWQMHAYVEGEKVTDGNAGSPDYFSFSFDEFGALSSPPPVISVKDWVPVNALSGPTGSSTPQDFVINLTGTTQFTGSLSADTVSQDGHASGELSGLEVDDEGVISARYTNGVSTLVGQVAIANFRNEQGLTPVGGTSWEASADSGVAVVNAPGSGVAGTVRSGALEDSNVDLSEELVKMILAQRDYQANAKTIQAADTLTQTIINLR
ncbi:flagellar hook-basal body complex protein [Oceanospirillum beijerinckii]|uniref:flagellar hook-basal body complex protein n=1 Tax=Oceanospirillum beijerinckii TaxID=64976 RepID=UPI0004260315|nr:flagellar hook-basal body complex protein [Oceanospirillum beijerinckii]